MTWRLVGIALALFVASSAAAQSIPVRSGEHDGFSRLVFSVPTGVKWAIQEGSRTAELIIKLPNVTFDTSQVFDRISRSRLNDLTQSKSESRLTLSLGCDCEVASFVQSGRLLVIDIKDPKQTTDDLPDSVTLLNKRIYRFSPDVTSNNVSVAQKVALPVITATVATSEPAIPIDPAPPPRNQGPAHPIGFNLSEQRLLDQIGRAADQGLLTLLAIPPIPHNAESIVDADPPIAPSPTSKAAIGVSATTVIDRDMNSVESAESDLMSDTPCTPSQYVAVDEWGSDQSFSAQIATYRSDLFGEFDRIDPRAAIDLAKTYLFFGFGAEARNILEMNPSGQTEHQVLLALAAILDGDTPGTDNLFDRQHFCDSGVALWAVLAGLRLAPDVNTNAVQQAFARLPVHLRDHIGPQLSRILNDSGKPDIASQIIRSIDRSNSSPGPHQQLAGAQILAVQGEPREAAEKMAEVIESGSEYAPQALIDLIEAHWKARKPVSPDTAALAAAYAAELRGSELAPKLRRANAISLALAGQFDASVAAINALPDSDEMDEKGITWPPVLELVTENADDVTFLKHSLWRTQQNQDRLSIVLEDKMARRMLDLGFAQAALTLLETPSQQSVSVDRRIMRAEAAIATNRPRQALLELLGLNRPEVARLRAQAMARNGDYQIAGQTLLDAEMPEDAARGFWISGAWDSLPKNGNSPYYRATETSLQLQRKTSNLELLAPLAEARALLQDSAQARKDIDVLLETIGQDLRTN